MENWKPVVGYEGLYEVSDLGRVRSLKRGSGGRPRNSDGTLKLNVSRNGYLSVTLSNEFRLVYRHFVHVLVMSAFVGPPPSGYEIDHKHGIKSDNRLSELEYVTRSENERRAFALGLKCQRGNSNNAAKLNAENVLEIRRLLKTHSQREIAKKFGVHFSTICEISRGRSWAHI